jgi:hypothetical protein
VFPLKLFEYLAAGKGVVSTPLQSLHEFVEAGVLHLAGDVSGFAVALSELVSAPAGQVEHRVRLAAQHTWDQRVLEVEGLVETALVRRI